MKTKICRRCKESKPLNLTNYGKRACTNDGWHRYCKVCINIMAHELYIKHKEKRLKKQMEYYEAHRDVRVGYQSKYNETNKEKFHEKYVANRSEILEKLKLKRDTQKRIDKEQGEVKPKKA